MPTCKCSECILLKFKDARNVEHVGRSLSLQKKQEHELADKARMAAAKAQADVENTILLATLGAPDNPHGSSLPERRALRPSNDRERDGEDRYSVRSRLVRCAPILSTQMNRNPRSPSLPGLTPTSRQLLSRRRVHRRAIPYAKRYMSSSISYSSY